MEGWVDLGAWYRTDRELNPQVLLPNRCATETVHRPLFSWNCVVLTRLSPITVGYMIHLFILVSVLNPNIPLFALAPIRPYFPSPSSDCSASSWPSAPGHINHVPPIRPVADIVLKHHSAESFWWRKTVRLQSLGYTTQFLGYSPRQETTVDHLDG